MKAFESQKTHKEKVIISGLLIWLIGELVVFFVKKLFNIGSLQTAYNFSFLGFPLYIQLLNIIFTCIIEEMAFRLYLSLRDSHISISVASLFFFCVYDRNSFFLQASVKPYIFQVLLAIVIGSSIFLILRKFRYRKPDLSKKVLLLFISASALFCTLFHIGNYGPLNICLWKEYIVTLTPLFLTSFLVAYYRVYISFFAGCLTHIIYDLIAILPMILI